MNIQRTWLFHPIHLLPSPSSQLEAELDQISASSPPQSGKIMCSNQITFDPLNCQTQKLNKNVPCS